MHHKKLMVVQFFFKAIFSIWLFYLFFFFCNLVFCLLLKPTNETFGSGNSLVLMNFILAQRIAAVIFIPQLFSQFLQVFTAVTFFCVGCCTNRMYILFNCSFSFHQSLGGEGELLLKKIFGRDL